MTCFGPLKRLWESTLNTYVSTFGASKGISKATFIDLLSGIWHKGLTPSNVIVGFTKTGIFPIERTKFAIERLDCRMVARYKRWVDLGKPEEMWEDAALSVHTPQKMKCANESSETLMPTPVEPAQQPQTSSTQSYYLFQRNQRHNHLVLAVITNLHKFGHKLGQMPTVKVPGKVWVPGWCLQDEPAKSDKSLEEIILDKMKGKSSNPAAKRRKVDLKTKVISNEELLNDLKREKEEKEQQKLLGKRKQKKPGKTLKKALKKLCFEMTIMMKKRKIWFLTI